MKDLIFITAHCPSEEQERALERCIDSVLKCDVHIALISHTHISPHIQKKCQYYFFDYLNDISDDYNFLEHEHFVFGNKKIQSRFFQKYFYGFAIYRMFSIAFQIAINFGYRNIHHVEYDCELLDKNLITENNKLLEEYDSVVYTTNGKEDGFLFGSFKSFKVNSLPEKIKNYDRDFIEKKIKENNPKNLELLTKNILLESGNVLIKNQNELADDKFVKGSGFYSRNLHYTFFYNPEDKTLNIFYNSRLNKNENIIIIVNNQRVTNLIVEPNHWYIRPLGIFDEINHVRIDNSEKIMYQKSFDAEFREVFKVKSYVSYV